MQTRSLARFPSPRPLALRLLVLGGLPLLAASRAAGEAPPVVKLDGILQGVVLTPDGAFKWKSSEKPWGILGEMTGATREFEEKTVEVGADRTLLTMPLRLAYEASRVKWEIERGEDTRIETKGDLVIMRTRHFSGQVTRMVAGKLIGRTPLYARASCDNPKDEAGLIRLLTSVVAAKGTPPDEMNGWLGKEVKVEWHQTPANDLTVLDDGKVGPEVVGEVMKITRDARDFVYRSLGSGSVAPYTPVVRIMASRDLYGHLTQRNDKDAVHLPAVGEMLVSPHGAKLDARSVAHAAARLAYQFATGAADAEPLATGFARLAEAIAVGASPSALIPTDEGRAYDLVTGKKVRTWATILKESGLAGWSRNADDLKFVEAELSAGYLAGSGGAQAKASLTGWVAGLKKFGHVEGASGEAYRPLVPPKSDAEFWDYWKKRADEAKPKDKPKGK